MQVVIMAGGKGERVESIKPSLPKALLPLGNKSLLENLIDTLKCAGASDIIVCAGHLADKIDSQLIANYPDVKLIIENFPLGTAGALGTIKNLLSDNFIVVNCDIISNFSYIDLLKAHLQNNNAATVGTMLFEHHLRYGLVSVSDEGDILGVIEKPSWKVPILLGIYAFKKEVIGLLVEEELRLDMPDLLKAIIDKFGKIQSFVHDGDWIDVGTPEEYRRVIDA